MLPKIIKNRFIAETLVLFSLLVLSISVSHCCQSHSSNCDEEDCLCYCDFKNNLKQDMTYNQIVARFGEPDADIGSGIHIYVYVLCDSSEVGIGYTDRILYARHMTADREIIEELFQ
jgi:hypothetical protein